MFLKFLILGLLHILLIDDASARLQVIDVNFIYGDPEYVVFDESAIHKHHSLFTIWVKLYLLKPFPTNSMFDVEMIEQPPGDILIPIVNYSVPICDHKIPDREKLPNYIKELTEKTCGSEGIHEWRDAGLFIYTLPNEFRGVPYPIVNANEIISDGRIILKYDVILGNEEFNKYNIINPYRKQFEEKSAINESKEPPGNKRTKKSKSNAAKSKKH